MPPRTHASLLAHVYAASALAAPSRESASTLLRLALGGHDTATPVELEAGLRALGIFLSPVHIRQLLAMYGFPLDCTEFTADVMLAANFVDAPPADEMDEDAFASSPLLLPDSVLLGRGADRSTSMTGHGPIDAPASDMNAEWVRRPMPAPYAYATLPPSASDVQPPQPPQPAAAPRAPTTAAAGQTPRRRGRPDASESIASALMQVDFVTPPTPATPAQRPETPFALDGSTPEGPSQRSGDVDILVLDTENVAPRHRSAYAPLACPYATGTESEWRNWRDAPLAAKAPPSQQRPATPAGLPVFSGESSSFVDPVSASVSWIDMARPRPSSRAGLRPRTASQLQLG